MVLSIWRRDFRIVQSFCLFLRWSKFFLCSSYLLNAVCQHLNDILNLRCFSECRQTCKTELFSSHKKQCFFFHWWGGCFFKCLEMSIFFYKNSNQCHFKQRATRYRICQSPGTVKLHWINLSSLLSFSRTCLVPTLSNV